MISTLKDALHENIHNSGVPLKQLADAIGISYSYIANAGNPNLDEFHFQLRHLIPLIRATNNFSALDHIEHACNRVAFSIPKSSGSNVGLTNELMEMVHGLGELSRELQKALEDGKVNRMEAKDMEPLLFDLVKHCMRFLQAVTVEAEGTK